MTSGREVIWEYKDDEDAGDDWSIIRNTLIDLGLYNSCDWKESNLDPKHLVHD